MKINEEKLCGKCLKHYLCNPLKKTLVLQKFPGISEKKNFEKFKKNFAEIQLALTFAPQSKIGWQEKPKRSLKVWKQQHSIAI